MGLRGFSTRLAHCSGGPRQRHSSAPAFTLHMVSLPPIRLEDAGQFDQKMDEVRSFIATPMLLHSVPQFLSAPCQKSCS